MHTPKVIIHRLRPLPVRPRRPFRPLYAATALVAATGAALTQLLSF